MSVLSQLNLNFDSFLTKSFKCSDEYICTLISKTLEQFDLELSGTRRKSLKIIKKVPRTILTLKEKIKLKHQYYYDETTNEYTYLLYSIIKIPKYSRLSEELKLKILNLLDHLSYADAGKDNLPLSFAISPVSVYNILDKSSIEVKYTPF